MNKILHRNELKNCIKTIIHKFYMIIYCIQYYKHNEISNKNTYDDANLVVDKLLLGKSNLLNNGVCSPMLLLLYDIFALPILKQLPSYDQHKSVHITL